MGSFDLQEWTRIAARNHFKYDKGLGTMEFRIALSPFLCRRFMESRHFQNWTRIGTMNRYIGARTAESSRTRREGTPALSGPRSEFRFMEKLYG